LETGSGALRAEAFEDLQVLVRREQLRVAAQLVARAFAELAFVERVALIGSVATPPGREQPRRRRSRSRSLVWRDPKDVDLAVWVTALDDLKGLQRARGRAVARLFEETGFGVAHHQVDDHQAPIIP
jgi:hypothetical protein